MENSAKIDTNMPECANDGKSGGKKKIIAAVAVCCALAICVCTAVFFKTITVKTAERKALNNDFEAAYGLVEDIQSEQAATLRSYLELRIAINKNYSTLIAEYNPEIINQWLGTTTSIIESDCGLNTEIISTAYAIRDKLTAILGTSNEYISLRPSILSLMDIFLEYNRLHTKTDGKNVSFSVNEELAKIKQWQTQYEALLDFSNRRAGEGNIYLLNYLLSETQSELDKLQEEMNLIIDGGYDGNAAIRYSDNIQQQFPDINNRDGAVVNLLNKDEYESYMYKGICTSFVTQLAEFYIVKG